MCLHIPPVNRKVTQRGMWPLTAAECPLPWHGVPRTPYASTMRHSVWLVPIGLLGLLAPACGDNPQIPLPHFDGGTDAFDVPDAAADAPPVDAGPDPTIVPGAADRILLIGTIVTPDAVLEGQLLVEGKLITCVDAGDACSKEPGASGATVITTNGIIAPGLIDTHNHILFDMFDDSDWLPNKVSVDHTEWTGYPGYGEMLDVKQCLVNDSQGKPAWCANTPYGTPAGGLRCEIDKWGELKGLIAGTTSIVGLPGTSAACFGSLARSIDASQNGLGFDKVQTSAIFPPSKSSADGVCNNFTSGTTTAYLIHVGEGIGGAAAGEFAKLGTASTVPECLYAPQTTITHGTVFGATEFTTMAAHGMKLTWSPASNVALYNQTTNIPLALDSGVTVALAPDWSMGGSQNLLDELRFANAWDDKNWSDRLSTKDLVTMVTLNGAKALALDTMLGQLKKGYIADIAVFSGDTSRPYDAIVAATPAQVRLVMVGGVALYGDKVLEAAAPAQPGCETLDICGASKFLCVATADPTNKLNQTYAQIKAILEQAMLDVDAQTPSDGFNFAPVAPIVKCK